GRRRYLTLDDNDGCNFTVLFKELQKECKIQHAWAKTIHTFQGSEAETVVYILGSGWYQHWKHVYTAVTRGQKRVYVLMCKDSLKKVIERRVTKRKTQLKGLVNQVIAQMVPQPNGPRLVGDGDDTSWLVRTINRYVTPFWFAYVNAVTTYPPPPPPPHTDGGPKVESPSPMVPVPQSTPGGCLRCRHYRIAPPTKRHTLAGPDRQRPAVQPWHRSAFKHYFEFSLTVSLTK
uniref:UvrD-like helicase C-terminal domain-containing protein n=1 Tax=Paramormyrops kingsleyae TaxID=1676925 RepID=A0A3B3QE17_9TELE